MWDSNDSHIADSDYGYGIAETEQNADTVSASAPEPRKRKTSAERLEYMKRKREQLNASIRKMEAAEKDRERKARTHRLIQVGGIVEKYVGTIDDLESFESYIRQYANALKKTQHKEEI